MSGALAATGPPGAAWDARLGLVDALAVLLSTLAAIALGLPDPWWAAITAWRVVDAQPHAGLLRGGHRIAGTLAGAAFGYVVAGVTLGSPAMQAILLFGTASYGTWKRFTSARWSYGWTLGSVTAVIMLTQALVSPEDLFGFAVARCLEILCGVVVASMTVLLLLVRSAPAPDPAPAATPGAAPVPDAEDLRRVALLSGGAMLVVLILWDMLDLPAMTQIAVSVLIVIDREVILLRRRGGQRLLGCLLGGAYALLLVGIGLDGLLPWAVGLGGGIFLFSAVALGGGPNAYLGMQGGMAVITALIVGTGPPDVLEPVLDRLAGVTIGAAVILGLAWMAAPRGGGGVR